MQSGAATVIGWKLLAGAVVATGADVAAGAVVGCAGAVVGCAGAVVGAGAWVGACVAGAQAVRAKERMSTAESAVNQKWRFTLTPPGCELIFG